MITYPQLVAEQWMDRELYQMNNDCFQLCRVFNLIPTGRELSQSKASNQFENAP